MVANDSNHLYSHKLPRTINPPLPNPPIHLILLLGPSAITYPIGNQFAHSFNYRHVNLISRLHELRHTPDTDKLGSLHPIALREAIEGRCRLATTHLIPIVKILIDEEVAKGSREFVLSGFDGGSELVMRFCADVAFPNALVFFYQPGDLFDRNRENIKQTFGERAVLVQVLQTMEETYEGLLREFGGKALSGKGKVQSVQVIDISMEDDEADGGELKRVDSPMDMMAAANAVLRNR